MNHTLRYYLFDISDDYIHIMISYIPACSLLTQLRTNVVQSGTSTEPFDLID